MLRLLNEVLTCCDLVGSMVPLLPNSPGNGLSLVQLYQELHMHKNSPVNEERTYATLQLAKGLNVDSKTNKLLTPADRLTHFHCISFLKGAPRTFNILKVLHLLPLPHTKKKKEISTEKQPFPSL